MHSGGLKMLWLRLVRAGRRPSSGVELVAPGLGSIAAIEVLARDVRPSLQADIKRAVLIGR